MTRHDGVANCVVEMSLSDLISIDMQKERTVLLVIRLLGHFEWVRVDYVLELIKRKLPSSLGAMYS
jgi:hypothetical protein